MEAAVPADTFLMPAPDRDTHDEHLQRYRETGVAKVIGRGRDVEGIRRDGTRIPLRLSVSESKGPRGRTFTGILYDLSEIRGARRALRIEEERTRLIVDTALDAVLSMDGDGRVTLWNTRAEEIFGWTAPLEKAPNKPELITLDFLKGVPVGMNGSHYFTDKRFCCRSGLSLETSPAVIFGTGAHECSPTENPNTIGYKLLAINLC